MATDTTEKRPPLVSVVMPVYNARRHLQEALDSIRHQTWEHLEILVIDDGSTDDSWQLIEAAARHDKRIVPLRNPCNRGLIWTLNRGMDAASGEFVARMDADDIALPGRIEAQLSFMEEKGLDFCGTWIELHGTGRARVIRYPTNDAAFRVGLLFQTPFSHPTLMMRRSLLDRGIRYREEARHAEEYDLALRLAPYCTMGNLPEVQLRYRIHAGQVSSTHRTAQLDTAAAIRRQALALFGIRASERELELHGLVRYPRPVKSLETLREFREWLERLGEYFRHDREAQRIVAEQWFRLCVRAAGLGPGAYREYRRFRYRSSYPAGTRRHLDLLLATLLRLEYGGRLYHLLERFSLTTSL